MSAPPLAPFGLVLHHDGAWTHEGQPITNGRLRARFDRSVRYLPEAGKYVVEVGRYRGEIEVEEAAFFVRAVDLEHALLLLSDGSIETLDPASLRFSPRDGALLCLVPRPGAAETVLARFDHAAHAEVLLAVEETTAGPELLLGGRRERVDLQASGSSPDR